MLAYFNQKQLEARLFGTAFLVPDMDTAKVWFDQIECELSPENLTGDGEYPAHHVRKRKQELMEAREHVLRLMGQSVARSMSVMDLVTRRQAQKAQRTQDRKARLQEAVRQGFRIGTRVELPKGQTGTIVKVNRVRMHVRGTDGRLWSVPASCLVKVTV